MSGDKITRPERYSRAVQSSQLRQSDERVTSIDTLTAAGIAGSREPIGLALWRAKFANDRHAYRHAQALLLLKVAHVARKRRWSEPPKTLKLLAASVMRWSVFGTCPVCTGRGHPRLEGVDNFLSDEPCHACHGYGITAIESAVPAQQIGRAKDIAALLALASDDADRLMAYLMSRSGDAQPQQKPIPSAQAAHKARADNPRTNSNDRLDSDAAELVPEKPAPCGCTR